MSFSDDCNDWGVVYGMPRVLVHVQHKTDITSGRRLEKIMGNVNTHTKGEIVAWNH